MQHPTGRITHTTAFVTPVVEDWLEREIAQWGPLHEGSIRWPIAPWVNALTTELHLTSVKERMTEMFLSNDEFSTWCRTLVKEHSDSKRGNPLLLFHGLFFPVSSMKKTTHTHTHILSVTINSKRSFIYIISCMCVCVCIYICVCVCVCVCVCTCVCVCMCMYVCVYVWIYVTSKIFYILIVIPTSEIIWLDKAPRHGLISGQPCIRRALYTWGCYQDTHIYTALSLHLELL